jgi:hypothetical protein
VIITYDSPFVDIESCVINFLASGIIAATTMYGGLTVKQLPNFAPNDYFFEHHQREGELEW